MRRIILASSIACAVIIAGLVASQNLTSDVKMHEESAGLQTSEFDSRQELQKIANQPLLPDLIAAITKYIENSNPVLQAEFHAMVYPLFIIGGRKFNFQTYYEYSINAKRVDILMKNGVRCIVIELKRNGNVEAALKQAFDYYADLQKYGQCKGGVILGINAAGTVIEAKHDFGGSENQQKIAKEDAYNLYNHLKTDVKRKFADIPNFLIS